MRENVTYDHFIVLCFDKTDMGVIEKKQLMENDKNAEKLIKNYALYKKVRKEESK